jgi:hypothetical protein
MPLPAIASEAKQSGNAVVLILIGVALFGALAYTFMRGSKQGQGNLTDQRVKLLATEIISSGNTLKQTVDKLRQRGCSENEISFEATNIVGFLGVTYFNPSAPSDKTCHVYDTSGGKLTPFLLPSGTQLYTDSQKYFGYSGNYRITNLGSIGSELIAGLPDLPLGICNKINQMLNITTMPVRTGNPSPNIFVGTFAGVTHLTSDYRSACIQVEQMGGAAYRSKNPLAVSYVYYTVLIER